MDRRVQLKGVLVVYILATVSLAFLSYSFIGFSILPSMLLGLAAIAYGLFTLMSIFNIASDDRFLRGAAVDVGSKRRSLILAVAFIVPVIALLYTTLFVSIAGVKAYSGLKTIDMEHAAAVDRFLFGDDRIYDFYYFLKDPSQGYLPGWKIRDNAIKPAGDTATEGAANYMRHLRAIIRQSFMPSSYATSKHAVVFFTVNRKGNVLSAEIMQSSGSTMFDTEALDAIKKASPLPELPSVLPEIVDVQFAFDYNTAYDDRSFAPHY